MKQLQFAHFTEKPMVYVGNAEKLDASRCSVPNELAAQQSPSVKGDRGISSRESAYVLRSSKKLLPVGTREYFLLLNTLTSYCLFLHVIKIPSTFYKICRCSPLNNLCQFQSSGLKGGNSGFGLYNESQVTNFTL